jgi:hypothetical protein
MFMNKVIRTQGTAMTKELIEHSRKRHEFADGALIITTVTLVVSLVIAATAVSIGIARADTLGPMAESGSGRFALTVFLGLVIAGMGGLTAAMLRERPSPSRRN